MAFKSSPEDKWKLAVSHPLPHSNFNHMDHSVLARYSSSSYNSSTDQTTINISGSFYSMMNLFPSGTDANHLPCFALFINSTGQRELKRIFRSVHSTAFIVFGSLQYSYSSSNVIYLTTASSPASNLNLNQLTSNVNMNEKTYNGGGSIKIEATGSGNGFTIFTRNSFGYLNNTDYLFQVWYSLDSSLSSPFKVQLVQLSNKWEVNIQQTTGGNWGVVSQLRNTGDCYNALGGEHLTLYKNPACQVSHTSNLFISHMSLTHAEGLSNSGFYTFDEYPDKGTVQYKFVDNILGSRKPNGRISRSKLEYQTINNRKRELSASFTGVSETFVKSIQRLRNWQKMGYVLHLETPYEDLKPFLRGYLIIDRMSKPVLNLSRWNLNLRFIEA